MMFEDHADLAECGWCDLAPPDGSGSRGLLVYPRCPVHGDAKRECGAVARNLEMKNCPCCGGGGEVHWNPSRSCPPDPQMEESADCPECGGHGAVSEQPS